MRSRAGRDKGMLFLVVGISEDGFLLLADGKLRRTELPKKKKLKHVEFVSQVNGSIKEQLLAGLKVANADIRKYLLEYMSITKDADDTTTGGIKLG